ncbi:MAG: GTPase ObgE [Deltaproteobacteria bacterium]|nr:GTPase ObgE [Deltaproteobacteria bacterium]HCH62623.1 GTPase ObgE [Deltaproteobacteria bacterium]
MRFIDEARLKIASGSGGSGAVSFRREKYVPFGGPDGGDGGRGGDVIFRATTRRNSLMELRGRTRVVADDGERGGIRQKTGAGAEDLVVEVPVGTRIIDDQSGEVFADLVVADQSVVVAKGGKGGSGNMRFKTASNRAPRKCTPGEPGEERTVRLELLLMADVGLLGFPNAGKSTLIRCVSAARPKVADYPFTTLVPNLGVVDLGLDGSFVIADIPGLIRGAAEGAGLGHQFLRHVSRNRLLLHLISLGPDEAESPIRRYHHIRRELEHYDARLLKRPEVVVLTKIDTVPPEIRDEVVQEVRTSLPDRAVFVISSPTRLGIDALKLDVWRRLQDLPAIPAPLDHGVDS